MSYLSYRITLAKLHIWQSRKEDKIPQFLKQVRNTLLLKIRQKKFQAEWLLYKWHLYLINYSSQI